MVVKEKVAVVSRVGWGPAMEPEKEEPSSLAAARGPVK
jgi:hypothetical protein